MQSFKLISDWTQHDCRHYYLTINKLDSGIVNIIFYLNLNYLLLIS